MIDISQGDLQELLAEVRQSVPCNCNNDGWEPQQCQWCDEFGKLVEVAKI